LNKLSGTDFEQFRSALRDMARDAANTKDQIMAMAAVQEKLAGDRTKAEEQLKLARDVDHAARAGFKSSLDFIRTLGEITRANTRQLSTETVKGGFDLGKDFMDPEVIKN
jgi:septal ring factor EnvC (AmiA/AmiB activator)